MKLQFTIVTCLIAHIATLTDTDWNNFKLKFGKNYTSTSEELFRKLLFKQNYQKILAHNANADKGLVGFRLAPNHLTDRTTEEYEALLGSRIPTAALQNFTKPSTTNTTIANISTDLPAGVDYRWSRCSAPIKNQGRCGSCWAFSATYVTEFYNCQKKGSLTELSEQNLVDCDNRSSGCNGGISVFAWSYVINNGQCSSWAYPYTAMQGQCERTSCKSMGELIAYQFVEKDALKIMEVLARIGPVSVNLDASLDSFRYYRNGVYDDPACTTTTNHSVNIVGYGVATDGTPFWIIRNSWGGGWGDGGYMFIKRGVNMCGVESFVAYPIA